MPSKDFRTGLRPIGRVNTGLGVLQLEIVHGSGVLRMDPNTAVQAGYEGDLKLGETVAPSSISGAPGYLYRSSEMQLALTLEELYRFLRRNLRPDEFLGLYRQFGSFFEIHDDFYDETTGEALQPVE